MRREPESSFDAGRAGADTVARAALDRAVAHLLERQSGEGW